MGIVIIPAMFLLVLLSEQAFQLYNNLHFSITQDFVKDVGGHPLVEKGLSFFGISKIEMGERIITYIKNTSMSFFESITEIISYPLKFNINFFLMMHISFSFLKMHIFRGGCVQSTPLPKEHGMDVY